MERFLRSLGHLTPGRLLVVCWAAIVVLAVLMHVPILEGVATAAALAIFCGYPYALILGLPHGIVRPAVKAWASRLFVGFAIVLVLLPLALPQIPDGYSTPTSPHSVREWLEVVLAVAVNIVVFAPFFLGSAALNDLLRAMREERILKSIPNFLALYFGLFGGLLYVHRRVREVLHAG